jgi:hypothetical protein
MMGGEAEEQCEDDAAEAQQNDTSDLVLCELSQNDAVDNLIQGEVSADNDTITDEKEQKSEIPPLNQNLPNHDTSDRTREAKSAQMSASKIDEEHSCITPDELEGEKALHPSEFKSHLQAEKTLFDGKKQLERLNSSSKEKSSDGSLDVTEKYGKGIDRDSSTSKELPLNDPSQPTATFDDASRKGDTAQPWQEATSDSSLRKHHPQLALDDKKKIDLEPISSPNTIEPLQSISSLITPKSQNMQSEASKSIDIQEHPPNTKRPCEIHRKKHKHGSERQSSKKRCSQIAIIEQDASFAFSPYQPIPCHGGNEKKGKNQQLERDALRNNMPNEDLKNSTQADDLIESLIQHPHDSTMEQYLRMLNYVNKEYSSKRPSRAGKRDLPLNQLEVVLRRRAIKKREVVEAVTIQNQSNSSSVQPLHNNSDNASTVAKSNLMYPPIPRPSSRESQSTASRRTLFPVSHGHTRINSLGMDTTFEDDSTISSVASALTTGNTSAGTAANTYATAQSLDPQIKLTPTQQRLDLGKNSCLSEVQLPEEEVVGDTSLGLKLTILHGKVIVQSISPLDDGRASPAQLCGLFRPGDILIAVDGLSLINGNIHSPVPMDKMLAVLKPLSQPIEGGDGRYTREVRLRFVFGEGKKLLREQREREQRKQRIAEERKKMGLDGKAGAMTTDPAADIFGLSALMGVDQHTGMPLFQQHHLETHHSYVDEEEEAEKSAEEPLTPDKQASNDIHEQSSSFPSLFTKTPRMLQSQIAHQLAVERQWIRSRNTSEFFTFDRNASLLLRAPTIDQTEANLTPKMNPIEARKKRLELGSANISYAKEIVSTVEKQERGIDLHSDEDPMEVASRVCGTASVRTGASRRRWHRGDSVILEDAQSTAVSASSMDNQADTDTLRSGESIEACDHRLLVDLAANNHSWKMNVIKRLEEYAADTEKSSNDINNNKQSAPTEAPSSLDSLLFGSEVANILGKKKSSLALPPGEMTQMLFDLKEHLESGLPVHIFMNDDTLSTNNHDKAVTFARSPLHNNADITKAIDYLVNEALGVWLKSFRPLPWKQRRALWPLHMSGANSETGSMMSSHFDDGMSLSMMSGGTNSKAAADKRNLREIIEELELDPETRRET